MPTRTLTRSKRRWKTKRPGVQTCRACALSIWNYAAKPYVCLAINKRRRACPQFMRQGTAEPVPEFDLRSIALLFPPR